MWLSINHQQSSINTNKLTNFIDKYRFINYPIDYLSLPTNQGYIIITSIQPPAPYLALGLESLSPLEHELALYLSQNNVRNPFLASCLVNTNSVVIGTQRQTYQQNNTLFILEIPLQHARFLFRRKKNILQFHHKFYSLVLSLLNVKQVIGVVVISCTSFPDMMEWFQRLRVVELMIFLPWTLVSQHDKMASLRTVISCVHPLI